MVFSIFDQIYSAREIRRANVQNFDRSKKTLNWTQIFAIWDTEQNWPSTVQHFSRGECNWFQALGFVATERFTTHPAFHGGPTIGHVAP